MKYVAFNVDLLKTGGFLRTIRFNIQKFYMVLALRWVFCMCLRTDRDFVLYVINLLVFI